MTFTVNRNNVITRCTSGTEIIGSIVKEKLQILDFVVIKRESRNRRIKYGIYAGKINNNAIIRTTDGDEVLCMDKITPIYPSNTLIENFVANVKTLLNSRNINTFTKKFINFFVYFIQYKFNDISVLEIPVCTLCGALFPTHFDMNGEVICDDCYDSLYTTCERCGETMLSSDAINGLCQDCYAHHWITSYHRDRPELKFFGDTHCNYVPYLGIELEVAYGGCEDDVTKEIMPLINTKDDIFMYCSRDSSIENGFENITQPATFEYHMSIKEKYENVFNKLKSLGYLSHDTTCCGLHVHFNRKFFEDDEQNCLSKLLYLFTHFWNDICVFSRRAKYKMHYCKKINMEIGNYIRESNKSQNHDYRYFALNLTNENTIEIRIFRGTLNIETFFASIELVNNLACMSKYKTIEELQQMTFNDLLTSDTLNSYWNRITHVDREQ